MSFSPHVVQLVQLALAEDLAGGDVTTASIFSGKEESTGRLVAKAPLVLAGQAIFAYVMQAVSALPGAPAKPASVEFSVEDGAEVEPGTTLATFAGPSMTLLRGERVGLNLLQRMSGIATKTRAYQRALGERIHITDTRKTTPGLRELERDAVRTGGGRNHRYNLASGVLIKENHIRAAGSLEIAIQRTRDHAPHTLAIEIEVTDLDELRRALDAGADVVMLDNMTTDTMREAVAIVDGRAIIEVSGNVTLPRLAEIATLGVDRVSSGALTHSVSAADISMLFDVA